MTTAIELDPITEQTIDYLTTARDRIEARGLVKGRFSDSGGDCGAGAVAYAVTGSSFGFLHPEVSPVLRALADTLGYGDHLSAEALRDVMYQFNDSPLTSKSDMLGLFDTTIARLRG